MAHLALFGSVARDEARSDSDVDLLVEFAEPIGFFHLFRVRRRLEEILGARVDLTTPGGLRPELRDGILAEAVSAAPAPACPRSRETTRARR